MPASPEFAHRCCDIRMVKVLQKGKPKHFAKSDRHIGITGKIKIDLQRICDRTEPCNRCAHHRKITLHDRICQRSRHIGKDCLLCQTCHKSCYTICKFFCAVCSCIKLQCNILVAHDRSCNKLRKHRNIQCQLTRILLHAFPAVPIHINDIGQSLKRVKGNTDRQCYLPYRQRRDQFLQVFHRKGHIFKNK